MPSSVRRSAQPSRRAPPRTAPLLGHIGTDAAVKDLEAIRLALGGEPLTYLGFSSGTLIGLRYAERFPDGLRAMVLDGVINPEQDLGEQLARRRVLRPRPRRRSRRLRTRLPDRRRPPHAYRELVEADRTAPLRTGDGRGSTATQWGSPASPSPTTTSLQRRFYEPSPKASAASGTSSTCSPTRSSASSTSVRLRDQLPRPPPTDHRRRRRGARRGERPARPPWFPD